MESASLEIDIDDLRLPQGVQARGELVGGEINEGRPLGSMPAIAKHNVLPVQHQESVGRTVVAGVQGERNDAVKIYLYRDRYG